LIGYVFPEDTWHTASCNCLSSSNRKYISSRVRGEFESKTEEISQTISEELLTLTHRIRRKNPMDYPTFNDIERIISLCRNKRIEPMIKGIFQSYTDSPFTFGDLVENLTDRRRDYYALSLIRLIEVRNMFTDRTIITHVRRSRYRELFTELNRVISNTSDIAILIDAHDLTSRGNVRPLDFVTGDKYDILDNIDVIMDNLELRDIIPLASFRDT